MFAQFVAMSTTLLKAILMAVFPQEHLLKNFQTIGHAPYVVQVRASSKNRRIDFDDSKDN
jgi:hypothetical protein